MLQVNMLLQPNFLKKKADCMSSEGDIQKCSAQFYGSFLHQPREETTRPGFWHFGTDRVKSAVDGKCTLPLASCGLLHAMKYCCSGFQRNTHHSPCPNGVYEWQGNYESWRFWNGELRCLKPMERCIAITVYCWILNLLVCWFKNGCIVNTVLLLLQLHT